jgi:hypothetical protein
MMKARWIGGTTCRPSGSEGGIDTHHVPDDGDEFREGLNLSCDLGREPINPPSGRLRAKASAPNRQNLSRSVPPYVGLVVDHKSQNTNA